MPTLKTIEAAAGCARSFEFRIKSSDGYVDMTGFAAVTVNVDAADGSTLFSAACNPKAGDGTTRIVTVELAATASTATTSIGRSACIHWTDAGGKTDAEPFRLVIYPHS